MATRRDLGSNLVTVILVVCAVIMTGLVVRRELFPPSSPGYQPDLASRRIEQWDSVLAGGRILGNPDAALRIVEFSDFQCPFCARFAETLKNIRQRHPDRFAIHYRHLPLEAIHPHARTAALTSECAGEQGRFEAFHDAVFAQQDSIGRKDWRAFATDAGVSDLAEFSRCVAEERFGKEVQRDLDIAESLGLDLTPTIIINGVVLPGAHSEADLEKWIIDPGSIPSTQ